jgi:alkylation response protein AidB-like acyl-CoA dehydrogenase
MPRIGPDKQWTLFFDDVEVTEDRLVGGLDGGLGPVFDGLNPERIMGASIAVGIGRLALNKAAAYARERVVWGAPIGTHQAISHPLAEAKVELELARLMTQKAAALYDAGAPGAGESSNMAKYAAAEAAIKCVDRAIQTHGGNGFALEYGLTDLWWGVRVIRTAPVSREMILNYVAEHSLGLPKSYGR